MIHFNSIRVERKANAVNFCLPEDDINMDASWLRQALRSQKLISIDASGLDSGDLTAFCGQLGELMLHPRVECRHDKHPEIFVLS